MQTQAHSSVNLMVQTIPATEITLRQLKQLFGLQQSQDSNFFPEWLDADADLSQTEQNLLDRLKANFGELMEDPPMLENSVKMVVLAPLLDLAGFYRKPSQSETETSVDIEMEDEEMVIRGRIDVLVLKNCLWLLVIESKRSDACSDAGNSPSSGLYVSQSRHSSTNIWHDYQWQ